jgi:hypothetical protein
MIANLQYGWTLFINPIEEKYHWGQSGNSGDLHDSHCDGNLGSAYRWLLDRSFWPEGHCLW